MALKPQLITEEIYLKASQSLKSLSKNNRAAIRLQAIVSAKKLGMNTVAKSFGVTSNTLRAWVKSFSEGLLDGLDYQKGRGRKSKLLETHLEAIRNWTQKNCNLTIAEIVQRLNERYGLKSSKSAVHRCLHKLNLSYITPRPVHHKQAEKDHLEFKKKSQ